MKTVRHMCVRLSLTAVLLILLAACGKTAPSGSNVVHMGATNFVQQSTMIHQGESITLVNDQAAIHIIENGTWEQGGNGGSYSAKSSQEPGAPKGDVQVSGN